MNLYKVSEIAEKNLSPPQMIVDGLLPVGLSVLAGSPKLGKSWMALNLAYSVAQGIPFLNRPTAQGDVLYVDLEGSPYRIKSRMDTLNYDFPETLQVTHEIAPLGNGLIDDLRWWWERAPLPRLVILDTVGRLKSGGKRTMNAYENDSKMYAPLQKFALECEMSVLCITHLKKENVYQSSGADWMERISGSMGLMGCADCVLGLFRKRGESTAYLRTTARDVDSGDLIVGFDNGMWSFVSDNIDNFEFREKPITKFFANIERFNGRADDLCDQYLEWCRAQGIPHGLSETQPKASFGKQVKPLMAQGWRINKSITRERHSDGVYYRVYPI